MANGSSQPEVITVPLFESGHEGFGDALAVQPHRYNRVLRGFDASTPGKLKFGSFITRVGESTFLADRPPVFAVEWRDDDSGTPNISFISGRTLGQILNADTTINATFWSAITTDGTVHDDGSGTPFLYAAEGDNGNIERTQITDVPFSAAVSTLNNQRDKLHSLNGYLYGSVKASTGNWSGISFVLPGADPDTSANWSSTTFVGWPTTSINNIKGVRGVPVCLKPEGIFVYNRALDLWENRMPAWETMPHVDNGRVALELGSSLIIGMGRGGAVVFDGFSVRDFSPHNVLSQPDADTTPQVFSALGAAPDGVYAITATARSPRGGQGSQSEHGTVRGSPFNPKLTRRGGSDDNGSDVLGLRLLKSADGGSTFTDYTTQVGDGDWTSEANLDALDILANGDFFVVGHPRPFQGVLFRIPTSANSAGAVLTVAIWNGTNWITATHFDLTSDGIPPFTQSQIIFVTEDPIAAGWEAASIDTIYSISTDSQVNYYMQFSWSAFALSATVRIPEIEILPWRPSIDTTNFPEDGMDRAGCYPHLLFAKTASEEGTPIWHDLGAIIDTQARVDDISVVMIAEVGGSYGNSLEKILTIGRNNVFLIERSLGNEQWPFVSPKGLFESSATVPAQGKVVQLTEVRILGRDWHGLSNAFFYWRYDPNERWSRKALGTRLPQVITVPPGGGGEQFQWAVGYVMTLDTTASLPYISDIQADFLVTNKPVHSIPSTPIANPPRG